MPLGSSPSRDDIWNELSGSDYRNGGVDQNHLSNMYNYIFDSTNYSRDGFGNMGTPLVSSLSLDSGDGTITCNFTLDDTGGLSCTFVAQYWDSGQTEPPFTYDQQEIGSDSSSGSQSHDITGLTNGQEYEVRVTAYNRFNNSGGYANPPSTTDPFDWTNEETATPESPTYPVPTLSSWGMAAFGGNMDTEWNYGSNPSDFIAEMRVNGDDQAQANLQSSSNWGSASNPKEATWSHPTVAPAAGDEVEIRLRAGLNSDPQQSGWTQWYSDTV